MAERRSTARRGGRARLGALTAGIAVLLGACARDAPQDTLRPAGSSAERIDSLFNLVFWIAVAVFVIVEGLLVFALIRYRHRPGREFPKQVHGHRRLEIVWTIVPALLLLGLAVPTLDTIFDLARRPTGDVLEIKVTAHQWWWEVEYPELGVVTANEIHIPVGQTVFIELESRDVIHSFWVPRLAGKQDVIPGRTLDLFLDAREPGTFFGQCAEFCGLSHANMRFRVIAQDRADFQAWVDDQLEEAAAPPQGTLARRGFEMFIDAQFKGVCASCHTVAGTPAQARVGPDLTHFASRTTFAGSIFENTPENVARWLRNPPAVKPGSKMPNYNLTEEEIRALVAFLQTLE